MDQCNHWLEFVGNGAHLSIRCELPKGHSQHEWPNLPTGSLHRYGVVTWDGKDAMHVQYPPNTFFSTIHFEDD